MIYYLAKWNEWLGQHMFFIVLSALAIGFLTPIHDSPILRIIVVGSFAYMTFITALGTSFKEFWQVLKKPIVPLWILVLIHVVSPLIAWLTGYLLFNEDQFIRIGYLVGASTPIGVTSVIWTAMNQGSVSVALVAVTLDTLVVPIMLPSFFKVTLGQALQLDYVQMMIQLLFMITIPSLIGMSLHDYSKGKLTPAAKTVGNSISKMAFFIVIYINAAIVGPSITWDISTLKIIITTMSLVALGYLTGFIGSFIFKERSQAMAIAMIYCVGLRNISFGLVLALSFFPPPVAIPITMFILFQQPFAAIIPRFFKRSNDNTVS